MSVGARILKWQVLRAYATKNYGPPVTVNIYSDPGGGLTTVDGEAARSIISGEVFPVLHDFAGNTSNNNSASLYVQIIAAGVSPLWSHIRRSLMTFDLAGIPAGALINSTRFCFRGLGRTDTGGDKPSIAVYESTPLNDNNVVNADYNRLGSTVLSNVIGYDSFNTLGFNYFTLNSAGLDLVIPGGICRLGLREAKFDGPFLAPPWSSGKVMRLFGASRDHSTVTNRPYLEVTYQPVI